MNLFIGTVVTVVMLILLYKSSWHLFNTMFDNSPDHECYFHDTATDAEVPTSTPVHPVIGMWLISQLKQGLQSKYGIELSESQAGVIFAASRLISQENIREFQDYVMDHPVISVHLLGKMMDLLHDKHVKGENVTIAEIQTFILTAKYFS